MDVAEQLARADRRTKLLAQKTAAAAPAATPLGGATVIDEIGAIVLRHPRMSVMVFPAGDPGAMAYQLTEADGALRIRVHGGQEAYQEAVPDEPVAAELADLLRRQIEDRIRAFGEA